MNSDEMKAMRGGKSLKVIPFHEVEIYQEIVVERASARMRRAVAARAFSSDNRTATT